MKPINDLRLSTRIISNNYRHGHIAVKQNGTNAGTLIVEIEHAEDLANLLPAAPDLLNAAKDAEKFIDAIMSLYGKGLKVANWHLNGNLEPLDNFIEENSEGDELEKLRAAIAKATGENQ